MDYGKITSIIVTKLYPEVEASLNKSIAPLKRVISNFINKNYNNK